MNEMHILLSKNDTFINENTRINCSENEMKMKMHVVVYHLSWLVVPIDYSLLGVDIKIISINNTEG